jgi:multidrug efflux pump subunit AcrA (membrane-fusion protein)
MHTLETMMQLATNYADCVYCDRNVDESRASLSTALQEVLAERDQLQAELGQYPEIQADVMSENKQLRAQLERLKSLVMDTATQYDKALQATQLDLENERRKVTELVAGYEKDTAMIKELRAEVERLTHELDLAVRLGKAMEEQRNELNAQLITTLGQEFDREHYALQCTCGAMWEVHGKEVKLMYTKEPSEDIVGYISGEILSDGTRKPIATLKESVDLPSGTALFIRPWPHPAADLVVALTKIASLDPAKDSDEGYNEWGEADCFRKAQEIAKNALASGAAPKGEQA